MFRDKVKIGYWPVIFRISQSLSNQMESDGRFEFISNLKASQVRRLNIDRECCVEVCTLQTVACVCLCVRQDLASRARAGKLKLEEFQGGSFT